MTTNEGVNPDTTGAMQWGTLMLEIAYRGLSVSIHHDAYPVWTCRLWRDVGRTHIDVEATAWSPLDALLAALEKAKP